MFRVTTGCVTCRIRRVKCDEEKPHCRRCKSTKRRCEGYVNAPLSRKGLGPSVNARLRDQVLKKPGSVMLMSLRDVNFDNQKESSYFEFFRSCSIPNTNLFVADNFWSRVILQATPAEPSIKHGIVALGALHRLFDTNSDSDREYAFQQYALAIRHMASVISGQGDFSVDYNILLMSIIVFHCFEIHVGNFTAANSHLRAGLRFIEEAKHPPRRKSSSPKTSSVLDEITRTLHRLDVHSLTMSEETAPYEWPKTLDYENSETSMPTELSSIDQARDILMVLFKRSSHVNATGIFRNLGRIPDFDEDEHEARRVEVAEDLRQWKRLVHIWLSKPQIAALCPSPYSFLLFEAYYTVAVLNLEVCKTRVEMTWDLYTAQCAHVIKTLAKLFGTRSSEGSGVSDKYVSYDLGIIAPLFWMAIKVRDPLLRREAIAVMASAHRREGQWDSYGAAMVAQGVIEVEEGESLGAVLTASDVPEERRVHLVEPTVDADSRRIDATFWRKGGENGEFIVETKSTFF